MDLLIYSVNEPVIKHFKTLLSENKDRIFYFQQLTDLEQSLETALEKAQPLVLIFHLASQVSGEDDYDLEAELAALQNRFKSIVNTVVVTNTPDPQQGVRLLSLNVRAYANTYLDSYKLETAINVVQQGEIWMGTSLVEYMLGLNKLAKNTRAEDSGQSGNINASVFKRLSEREQQIAQKILSGLQNKLIAAELNITERTVKAHLTAIFKKLDVRNRLELTLKLQQADRRERRERRKTS